VKRHNNLITVFIHFPVNLKMSEAVNRREKSFIEEVEKLKEKHDNFFVILPKEIRIEDLSNPNDPYHYKDETYRKYALEIRDLLININFFIHS
jgi:hypothetical protein